MRTYGQHGWYWTLLAVGYTGLAVSIALISVFLPPLLHQFTDSTILIGFAIGGEGLFALLIPLLIGPFSDQLDSNFGRRRLLMLVGASIAAAGLALVPFMPSYWAVVGVVFAFFVGYYITVTPYRALTSEAVPAGEYGRALSYQQVMRGLGFVIAVALGASLFTVYPDLTFLIGAGLLFLGVATVVWRFKERASRAEQTPYQRQLRTILRALKRGPDVRKSFLASFLFEFTLAGLRTFIVLFFIKGLDTPFYWAGIAIGIVAAANLIAAPFAGYFADRIGIKRLLVGTNLAYGVLLLVPFFIQELWVIFTVLPVGALLGAIVITLSFPLILQIMPGQNEGVYSGLFEFSRGLGVVLGPLVTGAAIAIYELLGGPYDGYPAMWLVLAVASLLAALVLHRIDPAVDSRQAARQ